MNVRKFKEIVSGWENTQEKFSFFRTWADNAYLSYQKMRDQDYGERTLIGAYDSKFELNPEFTDWEYQWNVLEYQAIIDLYSKMGWPVDEALKEKKTLYNDEGDCIYYKITLPEFYGRMEEISDNMEFCYGILCLIGQINDSRLLYKYYVAKILEGLREAGLEKCLELESSRRQKAFIAMSFDGKMERARNRIKEAVSACGFEPMLIDIKEHNNQIVPEIYREIEESQFVIADLTGQRGGVYYEAGYAMAKRKPLILCCSGAEMKKVHFDVAQINTIFWENEKDLKERLERRIKATILAAGLELAQD